MLLHRHHQQSKNNISMLRIDRGGCYISLRVTSHNSPQRKPATTTKNGTAYCTTPVTVDMPSHDGNPVTRHIYYGNRALCRHRWKDFKTCLPRATNSVSRQSIFTVLSKAISLRQKYTPESDHKHVNTRPRTILTHDNERQYYILGSALKTTLPLCSKQKRYILYLHNIQFHSALTPTPPGIPPPPSNNQEKRNERLHHRCQGINGRARLRQSQPPAGTGKICSSSWSSE